MPLLVEGRRVRLPQSAGDLVRAHPPLEERARLLRGQSVQQVGPQGLLYVQQRELAVTSPKDGSVSILGSDDATTCHIVVLRHTGNGATCLTHCDGSDTRAEVPLIMSSIKSFSDHAQCGSHLAGTCSQPDPFQVPRPQPQPWETEAAPGRSRAKAGGPQGAPRDGASREELEAAQAGKLGLSFLRGSQAGPASGAGEPCGQCLISLGPGSRRQEASLCGSGTNVGALAGVRQGTPAGEPGAPEPAPWPSRLLLLAHVCWGPLMLVLVLAMWPVRFLPQEVGPGKRCPCPRLGTD
ncbi:protein N-terminal asparagine amidohydrolase isoform X3 [Enhydra lutris kenyoni]|uniref:Protein N-terminal asparagine amidohydrolase isoform X3 n=1 Tax=Enhydra lutris kenyoni TaxID=391180 RepID=A0A2Y9KFM4_ENHLU|nr:protein N-terminal asparagine amidohydrolase isoform X3 [Enhydra lutris kenyoni]